MTNKTVLPENCPTCGKKMEKGCLRCLGVWGWGWTKECKPWTMGHPCTAEAYRCQNCKMIMLSSDIIKS